ncbi:DUF4865 family protein [Serratia plymuthica]|uniref:DUF4865 family protein n=1 Tax=Serratia plymuthica TaxID=82996 RepID=UPI001BAF20AE|nr:DUF4865 family protein [Serratia plymuthica]QUY49679.1 DUF4865 family protein [Serratia plymuthica]
MLAMQYNFPLPADYDMAIIRDRIGRFGHLLDNCPQLLIKAYLYAQKGEHSGENLYAPFYLWNSSAGMSDFLTGDGFRGVSQAFGWPQVTHWLPWLTHFDRQRLAEATCATRQTLPIAPYSDLAALRRQQQADPVALGSNAVASIVAFDPAAWQLVKLHLWRELPPAPEPGTQCYRVGHLSAPFDHTAPRVDSQT